MWVLIKHNAVVHVMLIAATVFTLLGCLDAAIRSFEPDVSAAKASHGTAQK
jgi:hypothetical protein